MAKMQAYVNWVIQKMEFAPDCYDVRPANTAKRIAVIALDDHKRWAVHFIHHDELDFQWDNLDVCIGYVRGVERTIGATFA